MKNHMEYEIMSDRIQITCLYDMDIPKPDNFNECYIYEGTSTSLVL
jgi:hypothetical protein